MTKIPKNPFHAPINSEIHVTTRLRLQDSLLWGPKRRKIRYLIENHPKELWDLVHPKKGINRNLKVRLVRDAYALLKLQMKKIDPQSVETVNRQHEHHKTMRKLKKEISNGDFGTSDSRFTKIASRKVDE